MKRVVLLTALACLAITVAARASTIRWVGPVIGFPLAAHDIGSDQLGVMAGVTFDGAVGSHAEIGMDVVYHYWPTSQGYKAAFDRYLAQERLLTVDGSSYAFKAVQITPHVRVNALPDRTLSPWIQAGAGIYLVDRNLAGPDPMSNLLLHVNSGTRTFVTPGWNVGLGCEARTGSRTRVGVGATLHRLEPDHQEGVWGSFARPPRMLALTMDLHLLFGW